MRRIALALLLFFAAPAFAHDWFTGATNPVTKAPCCNDADCITLADDQWWIEGDQVRVHWIDNNVYSMPLKEAMPSLDHEGKAAACVWGGKLQCFFLSVNG